MKSRLNPLISAPFHTQASTFKLLRYPEMKGSACNVKRCPARRLNCQNCAICTKTVNSTESGFKSSSRGVLPRGNLNQLQIVIAKSHRGPRKALLFGERRSRHASTRGVILDCSRRVRRATTTWQSQPFEIVIAKSARTVAISTDYLFPKPYGQFPPTFDKRNKPSPRGEGGRFAFGKSVG